MSCQRFEREALERLERGLPLDAHFDTCDDCLEARAAHERLGEEIAALDAGLEPPPGWQARVRARVEERAARRRRWFLWLAPTGTAVAVAAVLLLWVAPPPPIGLEVTVLPGDAVRRGPEAQPGDRLQLVASTGDAAFAELRVYRDDVELVLRCSEEPPCVRRGGVLRAEIVLPAIGAYQPMLLLAAALLPAPSGDLDADAGAALAAGAQVELGDEIRAR